MSNFEQEFSDMLGSLADFDEAAEAALDDDGTFEAPFIPLRDLVIYPNMVTPLFIGRSKSLAALLAAQGARETIVCAVQKDSDNEEPEASDIYEVGVEIVPGRAMRLADGTTSVLVQGRRRVQIIEFTQQEPYFRVRVRPVEEPVGQPSEIEARRRAVLTLFEKCVQLNRSLPEDAYIYAMNIDSPGWLADLIATTLDLSTEQRQELLETFDPAERLLRMSILLGKELEVLEIEDQIHHRVQEEVDKTQREMFLREQMRIIQKELGEGDIYQQEINELRERINKKKLPAEVRTRALKELSRLIEMPPMAPDVAIIRTYLDWILDLPWYEATEDNLDIAHVAAVLDADHYGLTKAKDRILEHIAVRKLAPDKSKTPVLCFVGPPGTGKTSLGRSIARAIGRKFVRISLGGIRDEAEIRGHRRTYIGALPGRIIQAMRRAGTINPLFMLDEIDKLGTDFRGDPSSALLEVLDPEQNHEFSDHYLEVDYDLSQVMFITTANHTAPLQDALYDRLEVIEFPGYIEEEKLAIARQFLIPKELAAHGLEDRGIRFEEAALQTIIRDYTYEAGVRNLEREIANVCRKIARRAAEGKQHPKRITPQHLATYLGPSRVPGPLLSERDEIGVAMGLAWTEFGGDISPVEVMVVPGKGSLTLTGSLGDVMQESAQAALTYTRSLADALDIDPELFENSDIHIHLPEGAVPKDGPSAGVTLATALISAITNRPVRRDVAMTGEITLRGRVLSVGGIKEKVLAAYRVKIPTVIIPKENEKDLVELPRRARRELNIVTVSHIAEVLELVLLPPVEPSKKPARKPRTKKAAQGAGSTEGNAPPKGDGGG
ncbi:MAG: endopeptidase La [Anaerolineae bacterium]